MFDTYSSLLYRSNMPWKVSQSNIAKALGLSVSTVSLVVGNSQSALRKRLSAETVQRIRKMADHLGYSPNRAAQMTVSGKSNLIFHLNCSDPSELASRKSYHVGRLVHESGFDYQTIDSYWWPEEGEHIVEQIFSFRPEGVIVSGTPQTGIDFSPFLAKEIPLVGLGVDVPGCFFVRHNVGGAIREMAHHCLGRGKRPVLLLQGSRTEKPHWATAARRAGFLKALKEEGFAPGEVLDWEIGKKPPAGWNGESPAILRYVGHVPLWNPFESGECAAQWLIDTACLPDALICTDDHYALGVMSVLAHEGISVPAEIEVAGVDNLSYSALRAVSLTSVAQPLEAMCEKAIRLLTKQIRHPRSPSKRNRIKILPNHILWRESMPKDASTTARPMERDTIGLADPSARLPVM